MPNERITNEVLEELLSSQSIEACDDQEIFQTIDLASYANALIKEKNLKKAAVITESALNQTFGYQILAGQRHASRDKVIQLAFGLHATLQEAQRLLKHAGASELYVKNRRDAIIILAIENELTIYQTNDELYRFGEKTIMDSNA